MELYIHIPFCKSKCAYCDFASWGGREAQLENYVDAVLSEAMQQARELGAPMAGTLFLGGGTPSLLPPELLERLLCGVGLFFPLKDGAEVTSEANPGTVTRAWADMAAACGVNRVSMGMQALQPELLGTLGRIHRFEDVERSMAILRQAGIAELSVDLMFGLPGQTPAMWEESLNAALSLGIRHISCYGLIPEEGTPLDERLERGELSLPDEDTEREMYDTAITLLGRHGFRQYEISSFALPGHECRHNLGYWRQVPYLGLGASAASMLRTGCGEAFSRRFTNPRTIDDYLRMVEERRWETRESELISPSEACFETLMLGLRTTEGVSEQAFGALHGVSLTERYGERLTSLAQRGLLVHEGDRWFLTRRGMDIQNSVLV